MVGETCDVGTMGFKINDKETVLHDSIYYLNICYGLQQLY
jgi:hypothetical protein